MRDKTQTFYYGHMNEIVDIKWVSGYGAISLDLSGRAIRWSDNGTAIFTWITYKTGYGLTVSSDGTNYYVAINGGNAIM